MNDGPVGVILGVILGSIMTGVIVGNGVASAYKEQAVKAGVAFYSVDSATGEVKFEYRTIPVVP